MNHLRTEFAPVSEAGWKEINDEAKRTLTNFLAARRLVDFDGPLGWDHPAITTGRRVEIPSIAEGVGASTRIVRPVVELRTEFVLDRSELDAIDRGAEDPDLSPLVDAARRGAGRGPSGVRRIRRGERPWHRDRQPPRRVVDRR